MDISPSPETRSEKKDLQESSETSGSSDGTVDSRDDRTGDQEVESIFHEYPPSSLCDMTIDLFETEKKKKVRDSWRRFSRPIRWRCKWIEQKVRELQNQAKKYDRELDDYYQNKKLLGLVSESLFVSCPSPRLKSMRRRWRTRVEENADVKSYISNHNIFSYYESRKRVVLDARPYEFSDDRSKNTKNVTNSEPIDDFHPFLELTSRDVRMENLFRKIEETRNRSKKLKKRIMNLVNEHPVKLSNNHNNNNPIPPTAAGNDQKFTLDMMEELPWIKPTFVPDESEMNFTDEEFNRFKKVLNDITRIPQVSPQNPCVDRSITCSITLEEKVPDESDFTEEGFNHFKKVSNDFTRSPQLSPENPLVDRSITHSMALEEEVFFLIDTPLFERTFLSNSNLEQEIWNAGNKKSGTQVPDESEMNFTEEEFNHFKKVFNDFTRSPQASPENPLVDHSITCSMTRKRQVRSAAKRRKTSSDWL